MLLDESVNYGVTAIRAFVEVDATVHHLCLEAAVQLKEEWRERCHVQIVCFAQDPIFSGPQGDENRSLMEGAIQRAEVDVVGTTPYVESHHDASRQNIEWAVQTALQSGKHVDFHLDYDLDAGKEPLIWHVVETLKQSSWPSRTSKRVMIGHATHLSLFSHAEWQRLARQVTDAQLPVTFVGLPTSDIYMASAPDRDKADQPRGTLPICRMIRDHGLDAVVGINNVGNAFTPWGSCDPLALASLCVGLYQAGSQDDAELLFECVSSRARAAMGLGAASATVGEGQAAELLVVGDMRSGRAAVADLVWNPSMARERSVVFRGRLSG
ncbi:zinc metallopeptidase [Hirsutella rhossiliensis]|uniref:Zinc metallopeptidase n=1 Tax=Hirsutella rhossiliensis TaxID=111463 RepID=A0A9P8N3H2_9HYPO|nr:zinc metallopeptidase [Hirsutella rhossiliensis]KAH0966242.1 zinc metallopeptidase [Hirsutella rhossiliensis]